MNLSKTIVSKKVLFIKRKLEMRKVIAIVIQILIFVGAWATMTPDQLVDNTYVFGLFGSHDVVAGNTVWVLLGAMFLSVINIWLWWPKKVKVANTPETTKGDKSTEAKAIDEDPKTPTLD